MMRRSLYLILACLTATPAMAENSAEHYLLIEGTERFQKSVLNLEADILRLEQDQATPEPGRVIFYLNTALENSLQVESLHLSLNGDPISEHRYTAAQQRAFTQGATQPVHSLALPPGLHQLAVEFRLRNKDQTLRGRKIIKFENSDAETWVELLIEDVPGEIYTAASATQPAPRRIELSAQIWEAPK